MYILGLGHLRKIIMVHVSNAKVGDIVCIKTVQDILKRKNSNEVNVSM